MNPITIRAHFLYPPSSTFADDPEGWWSWPGNDFNAEGRQQQFMTALRGMEERLDARLRMDGTSVWTKDHVRAVAAELATDKPAGLLLVVFYNRSITTADELIAEAEKAGVPVVLYIGLGVCHGQGPHFSRYRRRGVHFIMSLDNFAAIENGLRLIAEGKPLGPP